jgi:putative FmdB family regulatory protein
MPIYDYVCGACRHRFEVFHGLNEAGPHQCPLCEGPVARAFAPPTIVFKGSGWAKVDRRSTSAPTKPSRSATEGGTAAAPVAETSGAAKTTAADAASGGPPAGPKAD